MYPKILMTGSSGFLGKILKAELLNLNFSVIDLNQVEDNRIDISKPFHLKNDLQNDICIHIAGKAHSIPKTQKEEKRFYEVNLDGTKNLCSALEKLETKPKSFIFISTVAVYGLEAGKDISEDFPLKGTSPYAKSKILAEEFLEQWTKDMGINLVVFRLPLIAGKNPPGNLKSMIQGIKTGKYLSIGNADAKKSLVWAEDIAKIIPKAAEIGGVFNLTDRCHPTFKELENSIAKALNKKPPWSVSKNVAKFLGKIGDLMGNKAPINSNKLDKITSTLTFNDSKAVQLLKWNPSKVLDKVPEML